MKKPYLALIFCFLIIISFELFARTALFKTASYYNYDAIDWQMADFKKQPVDVIFIGSSEVRYGFNPEVFDAKLENRFTSFNLGIDGMNLSYYRLLLPFLNIKSQQPQLKYAVIGVNVVEDVVLYPNAEQGGMDCETGAGVLQKGVFMSDFALDSGLDKTCAQKLKPIDQIKQSLLSSSYAFKHKKALRALLLKPWNKRYTREQLNQTTRGYHVRPPALSQESLDEEFAAWWSNEGKNASPLSNDLFQKSISENGVYEWYITFFRNLNIEPIFVSLPTNPRMIRALKRDDAYKERSQIMATWFAKQNVKYMDLGLKDDYDPVADFADRRHLSHSGADKFTAEVALKLKSSLTEAQK